MIDYTVLGNNDEGEVEIEIVYTDDDRYDVYTLYRRQKYLVRCYAVDTKTKEYIPLFKKVYLNRNSDVVVVMNPAFNDVGKWEDLVLKTIGL